MHASEKARGFQEILGKPIRDLGLKLEGSPLERFVHSSIASWRPRADEVSPAVYLTDEWGCPSGEPIIGIPFYLANPELAQLEKEMNDLEDAREIMMYLRHEAGHAFNYAYKLYRSAGVEANLRAVPAPVSRQLPAASRFRATMCGIWRDGMRRSIRMKILPKRLRCG